MKKIKVLLISVLILSFAFSSAFICGAEPIYVPGMSVESDDDFYISIGGDKTCIKSDDKILLCENFTIESPIVIESGSYVLDGAGVTVTVSGEAAFIIKKGASLTIGSESENGTDVGITFDSSSQERFYPYIFCEEGGKLLIYGGTTFSENISAENGGAIVNEGETTIYNANIENCHSLKNGGAIFNSGTISLIGGSISNCSSENGGAVYNCGTVLFSGTETSDCTSILGGAVYNDTNGTLIVSASYISGSSAENGGAVYNCGIAQFMGGQVENSTAYGGNGGAVYNAEGGECTVSGAYINEAKAETNGGVVYNEGTLTVSGGSLTDGEAVLGGCVYNKGTLSVNGGYLTSGTATYGGSVFNDGKMYLTSGSLTLGKCNAGKAIFNNGELHISGYPYIDGKYDIFIVADENNIHALHIDSEMKAEQIAAVNVGIYTENGIEPVYDDGTVVLIGEYAEQGSSHFGVYFDGEDEYEITNGMIYRIRSIWEGPVIYIIVAVLYFGSIAATVFTVRYFDRKKSSDEKRTEEN